MRDIASKVGVSVSTVSAVINGNKYVSPELKARIETAVLNCGYKKRRVYGVDDNNRNVAVILPGISSSFFPPLLNGICDVTSTRGMSMTLFDSNRKFKRESELIDSCVHRGFRNIILDSVCDVLHEEAYFSELKREVIERRGINLAVVERKVSGDQIISVYVDNFAASYDMTSHLIDCGRRKLVHIGGASMFPHTKVREDAFLQALLDHGIEFDKRCLLRGDFSPLSGFGVVKALLDKGIEIDGIFAANDQMAIGALKALADSGRKVPEEVAVAGFDNLAVASLVTPGLTTVHFPIYQMGYQAALGLADLLDGQQPQRDIKLKSRLIIRGSTCEGQANAWELQDW